MNFFLIESPLQLLNALEARNHFGINSEESVLFVFEGVSKKNFRQIKKVYSSQDWGEVFWMKKQFTNRITPSSAQKKLNLLIWARKIGKILETFKANDRIFIGEYRSEIMRHFVHKSRCRECILLDDGNYSLEIQKAINNKESVRSSYSKATYFFHKLFGIKDGDIFDINYFTIYKNPNITEGIYFNNYSYIKSKVQNFSKTDAIYFLGNNTPELGIIDVDRYLDALKAIKKFYADKKVVYVPHRRESKTKLKLISKEIFKINDFDLPIEWAIIENKLIPCEIASFFSSALDNCYLIFGKNIHIKAFKLAPQFIAKGRRDLYRKSYKKYESYNEYFQIVEI